MKIGLTAFQTYPYQSGNVKIDYKPGGGVGSLLLNGPSGQRKLDIYYHPFEESSKVANTEDNH